MKGKVGFYLAVPLLLAALCSPAGSSPRYTVTDIGTLPGQLYSEAFAINNAGQVVGQSFTRWNVNEDPRAFIWDSKNGMRYLGSFGSDYSHAYDINDSGQVVGSSRLPGVGDRAFVWDSEHGMRDLGSLCDYGGWAVGINDSGQVVGGSPLDASWSLTHAFLWDDGVVTDLGVLGAGSVSSGASDINNHGQIVGASDNHALLWQNGKKISLGQLPGHSWSSALDINDSAQIVGYSTPDVNYGYHAFLWQNGAMIDLGTLPGQTQSLAFAINGSAQVVGSSAPSLAEGYQPAFLWENGVMTDLNNLIEPGSGWVLKWAKDINDLGQIVGYGTHNGAPRAYLLTPVPEPSSILALLCCLGGIGGIALRRKR